MDFAFWDQHHFTRTENPVFATDPLLGATGKNINDLLPRGVGVEWM